MRNFVAGVLWMLLLAMLGLIFYGDHKRNECISRGYDDWQHPGGCYRIVKQFEAQR